MLFHPRNWLVHTTNLFLRSRLETNRTRKIKRATLQLQDRPRKQGRWAGLLPSTLVDGPDVHKHT